MRKNKTTKSALISSVISLFLCVTMLVGTTFAWFTDSVTSNNNIIKSGNLDVELYYQAEGETGWTKVDANTNVFMQNTLWEPGHTELVKLKVVNEGSLALKYQLGINIASEVGSVNVLGEAFKLSEYIKYGIVADGTYTRDTAIAAAEAANATALNVAWDSEITKLLPLTDSNKDNEDIVTMVVYMPTTVGNEANHAKGEAVPTINLGINLFATQVENEEDSFDANYDVDAPIVSGIIDRPESAVTLKSEDGIMIALSDELVDALPAGVEQIGVSISKPKTEGNKIVFDSIELVDQDGEIIDLANLNLDEKITVTIPLPEQTPFATGETVMIYHDGEYVATAVVDANGVISYDVEHLCEVTIGAVEAPVVSGDTVEIKNVAQLFGFAQDVNSGNYYAGKTVVLANNIDLKGADWTPVGSATLDHGFMGNFDGNGKTISNLNVKVTPDADGYAYAGFFGITEGTPENENVIKNLKIENVTINTDGDIVAAAIAYPYYTTVENITVCGDIAINGGDYTAGALAYTRRCVNASNITVKGEKGSYINGAITVGGVISDIQMNGGLKANYSNFSASNVTVTGNKCVGGISGIIGGQTLNGATIENVNLVCSDAHVGIVAGSYDGKPSINKVTYDKVTGATSIVGVPYGADSNGIVTIDGVEYAGDIKAFKAQLENGTVNLACNIALNEKITIANGKTVVLNLNGNTISATLSGTGNQDLFLVKGNLTVNDGTINLTATVNQEWNAMSTIFDITAGGVVTLNEVVANNLGGTDMNFVAHLNNWGTASLYADNSTLTATYVAVRVFNSGNDINNVTIKNSTLSTTGNAAFWVHNYTVADFGTQEKADVQAKLLNFEFDNVTFEAKKAAFRYGFTNAEYYTADGAQVVSTADELVAALAAGKNVTLANDITMAATGSNGYGKTGITIDNQILNGNGYTLTVTGAGATWDSAIFIKSGTIKNITVAGAMRGVFTSDSANGDIYLNGVKFKNVIYTFNSDGKSVKREGGVYITNCNMNGWTSFSNTHTEVVFEDCSFAKGSGYQRARPYNAATFTNCVFDAGFEFDASQISGLVFENCYYGETSITADNAATLALFYNGLNGAIVK